MEVPGKKSHLSVSCDGSNEDDEDFYCDPCENEGERQPAKGFCIDCQEYLCSSCFTIHKRPSVWRHHVLLDKDAMPKKKMKEQLNYECTEPCVEHSTKIIEYYCQTHNQLGCPVCITGNHRTCNDVDYIPHIAERYKDNSEINEIFESLESLQEETDKHTATANNDKLKVAVYEKSAKAQVLQLRDEFNSICDRLLEDIETVKSSDESKIKNSTAKYEEISKKIKTRTAAMEKKRSEMKVSQLFTEAKLSKLSVEELAKEVKLARESASIRHYEITFNVEELRDGLKLTFHDNEIENAIAEFECHSPSEYHNKLARNSTRPEAEKHQTKSKVLSPGSHDALLDPSSKPDSGPSDTSQQQTWNFDELDFVLSSPSTPTIGTREESPSHVLQPQRQGQYIGQRPSPAQFFQPSQQNIFAKSSLPFGSNQIQYPHPGTSHIMSSTQRNISKFDLQGIQSTQLSIGMPYSHLGRVQYPHQQYRSYGQSCGNQPPFMGTKTANVQTGRDGAAESQDSNSRRHTIAISKVGARLNDLIVRNKEDNEAVIEWIDSYVDAPARKQPRFIRALMTVICNSAIKGEKGMERLEPKEISARKDLMQRYLDHQDDRELQALFAVQVFVSQLGHPKGVLWRLFDALYKEDLIGEDTFFQWQRSEDEPDGKEECLKQTIQFCIRLIKTERT